MPSYNKLDKMDSEILVCADQETNLQRMSGKVITEMVFGARNVNRRKHTQPKSWTTDKEVHHFL